MNALAGHRVVFTGRLASMTRAEAADLVRNHGGTFVTAVSRRTSLLVVGQDGWPLKKDGSLADKLATAQDLQSAGCPIEILTEEQLLERLELEGAAGGVHKRFTLAQLGRLLKIPGNRLRSWIKAGLVEPVATVGKVSYFDFHQVTGVRTLWDLARTGVTIEKMRSSLEQLSRWLPSLDCSLSQLNLLERDGRLLARLNEGQLVEPSGQLHFDFAGEQAELAMGTGLPAAIDAESFWQRGCELEEAGDLAGAAEAYRDALYYQGPDAKIVFNLANVLYALGEQGQAAERFRQAIELDHDFVEAWNNLGNVLGELGQDSEAMDAFQHAVTINPAYADAHYNLADLLEQASRFSEARRHWKEYLRLEQFGAWADYARRRLAQQA